MQTQIGNHSSSFLRELAHIQVIDNTLSQEFKTYFEQDDDGRHINKKSFLFDRGRENLDYKFLFNTSLLQGLTIEEINEKIIGLRETIKKDYSNENLKTIIEFHPSDTTHNSYHIHFWSNDNSQLFKAFISEYLVRNNFSISNDKTLIQYDPRNNQDKGERTIHIRDIPSSEAIIEEKEETIKLDTVEEYKPNSEIYKTTKDEIQKNFDSVTALIQQIKNKRR